VVILTPGWGAAGVVLCRGIISTKEYLNMTSKTALICLAVFLVACSTNRKPVDDNSQHVKLLWRNSNLNWVTSSLLLKDSLLYFGSFNNAFCAANLADGKIKLAFKTVEEPYYPPVISGKRIYFSSFDLNVYCLDASGKLVWKRKTAGRVKNALLERDSILYIPVRADGLWAVKARTGEAVWHLPQPTVSLSTNQPLLRANKLYVGLWGLSDSLIAVDSKTGKLAWAISYPDYASSDPVASPEGLVVCNDRYYKCGQVKLLDYTNGKEIWSAALKCEALFQPLVQDHQVIVATYDKQVVCLNTGTGKISWATKLQPGEEVATKFCRFQQGIYFGTTARNLYCLDSQTGKLLFKEAFNYGLSDPLVANKKLYIPTGGNELWCLKE
jgi:outer membrane protein assembly factor BamB